MTSHLDGGVGLARTAVRAPNRAVEVMGFFFMMAVVRAAVKTEDRN